MSFPLRSEVIRLGLHHSCCRGERHEACYRRLNASSKEDAVKAPPWHSRLLWDRPVYHDETRCTEGNNIEPHNRVSGTGGRPKCKRCREISG